MVVASTSVAAPSGIAASPPVDEVFARPLERIEDFKFDEEVASVFDDMVSRSVPQYGEIQRMLAELAAYFATAGSNIYDLGCSTGTTLALVHGALPVKANLIGVDNSAEMLEKCRAKLAASGLGDPKTARHSTIASVCPALTVSPVATSSSATTPSFDAFTSFCIFIASTTTTPSPRATEAPRSTRTATTLPGIGAARTCRPSSAASPAPCRCAGSSRRVTSACR